MIARTWRGATSSADADRYHAYLERTGVAECRATEGNTGVYVLRRAVGGRAEFLFVSLWSSMEAVERFAGSEPERAVFFPEDDEFLVEREELVSHYEVMTAVLRDEEPTSVGWSP